MVDSGTTQWRITRSGGFAGAEEGVQISDDGTITIESFLQDSRTIKLPHDAVTRLEGALHEACAMAIPAASSQHPDRYVYRIEHVGHSAPVSITGELEGASRDVMRMVDRLLDDAAP